MEDDYIWIDIAPGRKRQYKKSDLEARPQLFGKAPAVFGDEIKPCYGADGLIHTSRESFEKAAKDNNSYTFNKKEYKEHIAITKKQKEEKFKALQDKVSNNIIDKAIDYSLSNKI